MVYVHVPFCRSFCKYCDFFSEVASPTEEWLERICYDASLYLDDIRESSAVNTLYIGGGTPSVLPVSYLAQIADACGGREWREWTVEVNPDDITPEYASGLKSIGVNRISMGVQSLDDGLLRWMNRRHNADCARKAFATLRAAGFDNINVDLIIGINGLSRETLETTLKEIIDWHPDHISAYQLSVEKGSALGKLAREGKYVELSDEECEAHYRMTCTLLAAAGYEHYEISNWALPGHRAVHNSAYWVRVPYVGLGPGAHSLSYATWDYVHQTGRSEDLMHPPYGCNYRSWNSEELPRWLSYCELLSEEEVYEERVLLGLRTADGLPESVFTARAKRCSDFELLVPSAIPGNLRIPEERWFTADDIISSIVAHS